MQGMITTQEARHKLVRPHVTVKEHSMAKGKVKSLATKLISAAGTGFFYVTTKNPNNVKHKLALRKVQNIYLYYTKLKQPNYATFSLSYSMILLLGNMFCLQRPK